MGGAGQGDTKNLKTGSTLTGPALDYFRVVKGVRDTLEMFATGRPRIQYFADRLRRRSRPSPTSSSPTGCASRADDRIWAGGKVTIDRSDFALASDSLRLDTGKGSDGTLIGGKPVLRGLGADSFPSPAAAST